MTKKINLQILEDGVVTEEISLDFPNGRSQDEIIKSINEVLAATPKKTSNPGDTFSFAIGKSWVEIKDLFHYNWILYHKKLNGSGDRLLKSIGMKKPTFYSLHRKLANRGYLFPDFRRKNIEFPDNHLLPELQDYISSFEDKKWSATNKAFDQDVIRFLYHQYGYKKTKLAEVLGLGYSAVIDKTREITTF
jgi:hypothetical protein